MEPTISLERYCFISRRMLHFPFKIQGRNCILNLMYTNEVDILTTVILRSTNGFLHITPYNLLKVRQCFKVACHLHFYGGRISQSRYQHESLFDLEDGDEMFIQNIN
jgi:hypothetical protein